MKRRDFIKTIGVGAVGFMVGGCGFKSPLAALREENGDGGEAQAPDFSSAVEYRTLPRTGEKISTIGIGSGALHESSPLQIERMIAYASDQGMNLLDTVMSSFGPAEAVGKGLKGRRDKMLTQMHIGVHYPSLTYTRTRDLKQVQQGFEQQLKTFGTDYSDIGLIHYVDEADDFDNIMTNGVFDYAQKLKQNGTIRHLGFSSHSVDICRRFLETGAIDIFMLSLNAAYDFVPADGKLKLAEERRRLYQECEKRGVAITVMKAYGGGRLLSSSGSPFGRAMTTTQCIQYALDRPAVVSCLPGLRNMDDIAGALAYYKTSREERDYSFIADARHQDMDGVCIYCNHCQPCPYGIDIGAVSKYLDLAQAGDALAKDHYFKLNRTAQDCSFCGQCEPRCPFRVKIEDRMREAKTFFGR